MKYLPKNLDLKYRNDGDIDYDKNSTQPNHVQYNNCREAIRQAKAKGLNHVHWRTSVACDEAISADGYIVHNDGLDTISWGENYILDCIKKLFFTKKNASKKLWEILVPASNNNTKFSYEHHKDWDSFVHSHTNGLTIMRVAKGEWVSPEGELYKDRMIPVKISCDEETIFKIAEFTGKHYNQEAVFFYKISDECYTLKTK